MTRMTAANQAEADYRRLMDSVSDYAILFLDPAGYVVGWNAGAQHLFGYREDEIRGEHFGLLFFRPEEQRRGEPDQELKTAAAQGRVAGERWYVRQDGIALWCRGTTTVLRDRGGHLCGFAKVLRDLTRQPQGIEPAGFTRDVQDLLAVIHGRREFLLGKLGLGDRTRTPVDGRQVEVINTGEELLLRARVVARRIEERVWRAMEGHGLPPPQPPEDK